jgi:hypothetical protein
VVGDARPCVVRQRDRGLGAAGVGRVAVRCGAETGEERERGDADTWACPGLKWFKQIQTDSNMIQTISNLFKLDSIQTRPSRGQKIKIKYGFEVFE